MATVEETATERRYQLAGVIDHSFGQTTLVTHSNKVHNILRVTRNNIAA